MSVPRFISTLHCEILLLRGEVPNFASHLRCICVVARTAAEGRGSTQRKPPEVGPRVVGP